MRFLSPTVLAGFPPQPRGSLIYRAGMNRKLFLEIQQGRSATCVSIVATRLPDGSDEFQFVDDGSAESGRSRIPRAYHSRPSAVYDFGFAFLTAPSQCPAHSV